VAYPTGNAVWLAKSVIVVKKGNKKNPLKPPPRYIISFDPNY
jgi:hypothetical protein